MSVTRINNTDGRKTRPILREDVCKSESLLCNFGIFGGEKRQYIICPQRVKFNLVTFLIGLSKELSLRSFGGTKSANFSSLAGSTTAYHETSAIQ